jgi:hypothetical protein
VLRVGVGEDKSEGGNRKQEVAGGGNVGRE